MAEPSASDAFLSGRGIPVELKDVDSELARLWGPAAELEGGPDLDHPNVTRIVLANVVAADLGGDPARVDGLLETVTDRYPCRAIVIRGSAEPARKVSAEVSAVCHLPTPGRPQVCAERIVLHAGADARDLLPGAVLPLLETDLPLILWWSGDPRPYERLFRELATVSTRIILDLPDPEAEPKALRVALDLNVNAFGRDIAWFGISPWRELCAQFFDQPGAANALTEIRHVRITAVSPAAGSMPRVAMWLASWLAGQLRWDSKSRSRQDRSLAATFVAGATDVAVEIHARVDPGVTIPHLMEVVITTEPGVSFRLSRSQPLSDEVRVEANAPQLRRPPRRVHAPGWDATRRLAAALESARDDPPYRQALPHLLWLIE